MTAQTTATDKLQRLISRCKCGVFITVNEHRTIYQSAKDWLDNERQSAEPADISDTVRANMIWMNTIIFIQIFPDTPVSSWDVWHYDMEAALDAALACVDEADKRKLEES